MASTAFGMLISTLVRSQVAALFGTLVLSMLPAVQFSGLVEPVSSLVGVGRFVGEIFPTTHFLTISRGTFSKGLMFTDLRQSFLSLAVSVPVLIGLATLLLRKQER
jgi:ribosome-dependent ATPase